MRRKEIRKIRNKDGDRACILSVSRSHRTISQKHPCSNIAEIGGRCLGKLLYICSEPINNNNNNNSNRSLSLKLPLSTAFLRLWFFFFFWKVLSPAERTISKERSTTPPPAWSINSVNAQAQLPAESYIQLSPVSGWPALAGVSIYSCLLNISFHNHWH